ncbi:restriction endonuclease subunit S [Francisella tularensis]|uniref:restriction endonuclease subunit S n=1 Tax=Francisella tularensis TaxID=263 RepID=UPI000158AC7C|nr:restriction endonuclease subunit S [Francisella tularensis]AJI45155.1 type I restriction modification DNA specificity domain protein [Francisella tularensis subsp. novicida F6168]EDN35639.1 predicted protein [Francisella tularensis subsp. novicida GA99-3549]
MSNSELPKGWRECRLEEILDLIVDNRGKNPSKYSDRGIPVIDNFMIQNQRYINLNEAKRYIDIKTFESFIRKHIKYKDVLITLVGNGYGNVSQAPIDKSVIIQNTIGLRVDEYADQEFLFYNLKFNNEQILNFDRGAVQPSIKVSDLKSLEINLPPLAEQKAIAEVLSSLDDKIDLLHQQNQTLEDMAKTLFREWFIEKADEGWEEVKLGDYVKCINGYTYKSSELMESRNALVTLKNFARDGSLRLDGFKEFTGMKFKEAQVVIDGDLVVAHTDITQNADIIGNPILVKNIHNYDKLVITMDLVKVEPLVNWIKKSYLYCLFKSDDFKFHCLCNSNGSTVLHMSKKAIPSYIFKLPPKELLVSFTKIVEDIFEKQDLNQKQIKTLEQTRDTLLPKLMSGQVRV